MRCYIKPWSHRPTRLNSTKLFCWVNRSITLNTQLDKTVLLSWVASGDVTTVTDSLFCSRDESGDVITFTTQPNNTADWEKNIQNYPTVSSFVELSCKSDHIARLVSTRQNSFVELDRVGRCDRGFSYKLQQGHMSAMAVERAQHKFPLTYPCISLPFPF